MSDQEDDLTNAYSVASAADVHATAVAVVPRMLSEIANRTPTRQRRLEECVIKATKVLLAAYRAQSAIECPDQMPYGLSFYDAVWLAASDAARDDAVLDALPYGHLRDLTDRVLYPEGPIAAAALPLAKCTFLRLSQDPRALERVRRFCPPVRSAAR